MFRRLRSLLCLTKCRGREQSEEDEHPGLADEASRDEPVGKRERKVITIHNIYIDITFDI